MLIIFQDCNISKSLSCPTPLYSSSDWLTSSGTSAVGGTSSKARLCFSFFGYMKKLSWLHIGMSFGFSYFRLRTGGIGFMTKSMLSRDFALLTAIWGSREKSTSVWIPWSLIWLLVVGMSLTFLQLGFDVVAPLSCSTDKMSWQVGVKSSSLLLPNQDYVLVKVFSSFSAFW